MEKKIQGDNSVNNFHGQLERTKLRRKVLYTLYKVKKNTFF